MDETRSRSSCSAALVRLSLALEVSIVRGVYRRLFRGPGHLITHRVSGVFQKILSRNSIAGTGACVGRSLGGGSVRGAVCRSEQSLRLTGARGHRRHIWHCGQRAYRFREDFGGPLSEVYPERGASPLSQIP